MLEITSYLSIMAEGVCHNLDIPVNLMLGKYAGFAELPDFGYRKYRKAGLERMDQIPSQILLLELEL